MLFLTVTTGTWTVKEYDAASTVLQVPSKHHLHRRATEITSDKDKTSSTTSMTSTSKSTTKSTDSTSTGKSSITTSESTASEKSTSSKSDNTSKSNSSTKTESESSSKSSSTSKHSSSSSSSVTTTSSEEFPTLTSMTVVSTSAHNTSTVTYSYDLLIPNLKAAEDPFIHHSSMPNNLVFIVFGSVIAAILAAFTLWRISCSIVARKRARIDSEKYDNSSVFGGNNGWGSHGWNSSKSSFVDYLSSDLTRISSHSSSNIFNKTNFSSSDSMTDSTVHSSSQGRSYRNALAGGYTKETMTYNNDNSNISKGSMYFSPTASKFHLPWVHKGVESFLDSDTRVESLTTSSQIDMPRRRGSIMFEHFLNESVDRDEQENEEITEESTPRRSRPPSLLLEKFLDYDFDD